MPQKMLVLASYDPTLPSYFTLKATHNYLHILPSKVIFRKLTANLTSSVISTHDDIIMVSGKNDLSTSSLSASIHAYTHIQLHNFHHFQPNLFFRTSLHKKFFYVFLSLLAECENNQICLFSTLILDKKYNIKKKIDWIIFTTNDCTRICSQHFTDFFDLLSLMYQN